MFKKITSATAKPIVWSEYTADVLWTDEHIAKQMLSFHLNPDLSLASRTLPFIEASVTWLVSEFGLNGASKVIDFGCGPGLYTHRLKAKGVGTVVGLDFSKNSLKHATEQAEQASLDIEYRYGNYLEYSDSREFDLITLVMCDLCALNPAQRSELFGEFKSLLASNGSIALDVYTATRFANQNESLSLERNAMNGFWSDKDYWCIQSSFKYEEEKVTLDKYVISQEDKEWTVFNWLQHFTIEELSQELEAHGLEIKRAYSDLKGTPLVDGDEMAVVIGHK
ncbi:class I SAM-dependent methyltransferase [Vibrio panuliri]|uniref:Methyltransferase n=1 Tax=Vibrio panuliri TaxID=1381081 RepID=A0ABX3FN46_9VIBR|nr:class I SAM-dependent methyltransferase [Vibrio panuliri]KAB1457947.1 class I SAM-dependent methyltransferase [Vibrio panuliri]OLQ95646.1 methyltransferase [Vibrio panuliri]